MISKWASGIVICVVITNIIEILLPDNKNKKYIKIIIGIIILFTMIYPFFGKDFDFNVKDVIATDIDKTEISTDKQDEMIKKLHIENLEKDIKEKITQIGYEVNNVNVNVNDNLEKIVYVKIEIFKEIVTDKIIKKVDININNTIEEKTEKYEEDKKTIENFLIKEYLIDKNDIEIIIT